MSKKKKKKKNISILKEVDNQLNKTYDSLIEEIGDMQRAIAIADEKARRKLRKKARKEGLPVDVYYQISDERRKVREEIVGNMETTNFLERIYKVLADIAPIIIIIARLIASLICSILSLDSVKMNISKESLMKLNKVYQLATAVK